MHITAQKVSASALVVIDDMFHKILNNQKGFITKKTHWKFLFVCTSVPPEFSSGAQGVQTCHLASSAQGSVLPSQRLPINTVSEDAKQSDWWIAAPWMDGGSEDSGQCQLQGLLLPQ